MFYGCKERQKSSRIAFPMHVQSDPQHTKPRFSKEVHVLEEHPAVGSQE